MKSPVFALVLIACTIGAGLFLGTYARGVIQSAIFDHIRILGGL